MLVSELCQGAIKEGFDCATCTAHATSKGHATCNACTFGRRVHHTPCKVMADLLQWQVDYTNNHDTQVLRRTFICFGRRALPRFHSASKDFHLHRATTTPAAIAAVLYLQERVAKDVSMHHQLGPGQWKVKGIKICDDRNTDDLDSCAGSGGGGRGEGVESGRAEARKVTRANTDGVVPTPVLGVEY
mgnify:CR=1 FL=1